MIVPLMRPLAAVIPMKRTRELELGQQLRRVDMSIHPKEYYARALVVAAASLLLIPLIAMAGLPQAAPAAVILSVIIFFHFTSMHKDALKAKQERIELGLPGFIRSILHHLPDIRHSSEVKVDLIAIFEDYLKVANEVFYYDVAYLITEMKSKDTKTALRNFTPELGCRRLGFSFKRCLGLIKVMTSQVHWRIWLGTWTSKRAKISASSLPNGPTRFDLRRFRWLSLRWERCCMSL
jgi:hypothetical protein